MTLAAVAPGPRRAGAAVHRLGAPAVRAALRAGVLPPRVFPTSRALLSFALALSLESLETPTSRRPSLLPPVPVRGRVSGGGRAA